MPDERSPAEIKAELEQARAVLGSSVDQLAERLAPKKLIDDAKADAQARVDEVRKSAEAKVNTPVGRAVVAGTVVLIVALAVRNFRKSRKRG